MMTLEMKMRDRERIAALKAAQRGKEEDALEMLKLGMAVAIIQQVTKLPFPRIEELKRGLTHETAKMDQS